MTIQEIVGYSGGGLFLLLALIQVSPIKLDPLSWVLRSLGKCINKDMSDKIDALEDQVVNIRRKTEEIQDTADMRNAINCRTRILRFGDEMLHGVKHSKDHFGQILLDIKEYDSYCKDHDDFENNVTSLTSARILEAYKDRLSKNDFL